MEERVDLLAAKIMTVGERAEDVFYLASLAASRSTKPPPRACSSACPARSIAAPPREPAPRTTRRLPVRATRATEGRHHAARRALAHRDVHRRAQACAAALRDRRAAARTGKARQLSGDRGTAGNARRLRRVARTPLQGAGDPPRPWCCRSTARAKRCSRSCRRWSAHAGPRRSPWSRCRIRSIRSTKARPCSPAPNPFS